VSALSPGELMWISSALAAARETGLFAAVLDSPGSAEALSARCSLDARASQRVLDLLAAAGLLEREQREYRPSRALFEYVASIPGDFASESALASHTTRFLRSGRPLAEMGVGAARGASYAPVVEGLGRMFDDAAGEIASQLAARVAPRRILDVGCGSGVWSLALAERLPEARVTGVDFPDVLEAFEARATRLGLAARARRLPGDMHQLAVEPASFDLVVIANVLRLEPEVRARRLLARLAPAVDSGGSILVVDALAGGDQGRELARAVYALHLSLRTASGAVHAPDAIARWLADLGFVRMQSVPIDRYGPGAVGALLGQRDL
jgi:SAM-dependent methyltransferase